MADTKKYEPRLKTEYDERITKAMQEKFSYANVMQIPRLDKIVINMGVGESTADSEEAFGCCSRPRSDRRPEAGHHQGPHLHRRLQAARRHADRRKGYPARRSHVRIPGPPDQHRASARSRFPRPESEEL